MALVQVYFESTLSDCQGSLLRPALIQTRDPKLLRVEFGVASHGDFVCTRTGQCAG